METQELIKLVIDIYDSMERIHDTLVSQFNKNTKNLCKYWKKSNIKAELFMNWECNHPDADCDWGDTDNCSILYCADEKRLTQPAGIMASMLTQLDPIHEALVGKIFNNNLSKQCSHYNKSGSTSSTCKHIGNELHHCCIAYCPLRVEPRLK
jgi:hypothetical protein